MSVRDRLAEISNRVRSDGVLSSLIGDRFKAHWSIQGDPYPRATFHVITNNPINTIGGTMSSGTYHATIQISMFAERNYETAVEIASAMKARLHGWTDGAIGSMILTDQTDITADPQGGDIPIYGIEQDYSVWMEAA